MATVYLATSIHGDTVATRRLVQMGSQQAPHAEAWHYEPMLQETHATIYHPAALRAFRAVFKPQVKR
jgi:hypothetical protein